MITTSTDFERAATSTVRRPHARVEVTWTDPYIDPSIATSATDDNRVSYTDQTADLVEGSTRKWAHIDGTLQPDGTFYPMPASGATDTNQVGWFGATRCNGSSEWSSPYPTLEITFSARPVFMLLVVGDDQYNEYPVDFDVKIYESAALVHTEVVTGNASRRWSLDISSLNIDNATKMQLVVKKWSAANRVAKILEFYSSVARIYRDDDIVSITLLEEMEITEASLPIGNVAAAEIDIKLQNLDDALFPGNTGSSLYNLIKHNRRIRAWLGFELPAGSSDTSSGDYLVETIAGTKIGYVPLGVFWSGDWDVPELGTYAATSGRDRMEQLRKSMFTTGGVYENVTLYYLSQVVLDDALALMPDMEYEIDTELQNYTVPWAYLPRKSHRETLRDIVEAAMGFIYCDRTGVVTVSGRSRFEIA